MDDEVREESRPTATLNPQAHLRHYLEQEDHIYHLQSIIGKYVHEAHLVTTSSEEANLVFDIVSATIIRAFELVERKYHNQGIRPWLLRIAINLVLQKRRDLAVQKRRESSLGMLEEQGQQGISDGDFFRLVHASLLESPEQAVGERLYMQQVLAHLSVEDRQILNLRIVEEYTHDELMHFFGLKPSALRMRYKRALARLREAWVFQEVPKRGEENG